MENKEDCLYVRVSSGDGDPNLLANLHEALNGYLTSSHKPIDQSNIRTDTFGHFMGLFTHAGYEVLKFFPYSVEDKRLDSEYFVRDEAVVKARSFLEEKGYRVEFMKSLDDVLQLIDRI